MPYPKLSSVCISGSLLLSCFLSIPYLPKYIIFSLGFATLVVILADRPDRMIVNIVTQCLGKISYSIYLLHTLCFRWAKILMHTLFPSTGAAWQFAGISFLTLFLTLVISEVLYRLIELSGQKLGAFLQDRIG